MKTFLLALTVTLTVPTLARAGPITFNLRDPAIDTNNIDEVNSFVLTEGGLSATLTALPSQFGIYDVVLNQTTSSFGVNVVDTSCLNTEKSALLDGGCTPESIAIAFSADVLVNSLAVSSFGSLDAGAVLIGATLANIQTTGLLALGGLFLPGGSQMLVAYSSGNGFSVDNVTVTTATVSEGSSTLTLMAAGLMAVLLAGHPRRRLTAAAKHKT